MSTDWRFGVGQTQEQEEAEIRAAQHAGRTDEYMVGQEAVRPIRRMAAWQHSSSRQSVAVSHEAVVSSDGKRTYTVSVASQAGRKAVRCTCPGFRYRRRCRHIVGKGTPSAF